VFDVVFHENLSRLRSGCGPHDIGTVSNIVLNLLRGPKDCHGLKMRRKSAGWDVDYLDAILRRTIWEGSSDSPARVDITVAKWSVRCYSWLLMAELAFSGRYRP